MVNKLENFTFSHNFHDAQCDTHREEEDRIDTILNNYQAKSTEIDVWLADAHA